MTVSYCHEHWPRVSLQIHLRSQAGIFQFEIGFKNNQSHPSHSVIFPSLFSVFPTTKLLSETTLLFLASIHRNGTSFPSSSSATISALRISDPAC